MDDQNFEKYQKTKQYIADKYKTEHVMATKKGEHKMELTYSKCGDYYIPDLALSDTSEYRIGRYGRMRERFLKEHHPGAYTRMLLSETLWKPSKRLIRWNGSGV